MQATTPETTMVAGEIKCQLNARTTAAGEVLTDAQGQIDQAREPAS